MLTSTVLLLIASNERAWPNLIHISALTKHHERSLKEFPLVAGLLSVAGIAMWMALGSLWPTIWCIACTVMMRMDISVMAKAIEAHAVTMPTYLLMTFQYNLVMGAMALYAAGATRSATMFAVSRRVGLAYFAPYLLVPVIALIVDMFTNNERTISGHLTGILSLASCLGYIWKSWLTRHGAETALDIALDQAHVQRDSAARDATVSRLLFKHTTLRAALFDLDGKFIAVNPSWLHATKQSEADVLGKTLNETMPGMRDDWYKTIADALNGKTTKLDNDAIPGNRGGMVYLDWQVQPWFNNDGTIGGAVAYAQDVTDVHAAREAAKIKEERLKLALTARKAFIWEVDYAAQTVSFDQDAVTFFGHEPTFEQLSKKDKSLIHPDDRETAKRQAIRISQNGGYGRMEARHLMADGRIVWVRSDLAPSGFTDGMPTKFVMLTSDVTEEMARHERLATMMDRANSALGEKRKLLEELCGETSLGDIASVDTVTGNKPLIASDSAESTFTQLFAGFEQILTEIDDRDIALAAAVQQLRDARTHAETANLAKSQFMANMSHELRTPLNAIIGYTEILIEDAEYEERLDAAKDANKVRNSATHLLSLINEILDLSKIEAGKMDITREATPLTDVIMDLVSSNETLASNHGNRIVVEIDCERTLALTDGFRLRQCMLNLLSNACKFTENGTITLRLQINEADENNRWFELSVQDTGIGISQEQMERLFRPFSQADGSTTRKYGGTGLGLALTKEMTHLLGGDVSVVSEVGVGSTFTIRIPAIGLEVEDVATIMGSDANSALVLVVDDDPVARALTSRAAAALGMSVATAESGRAALAFCEQTQVDLIVLDIQLPDMDGYEVLMALRGATETKNIPVMVVSVNDDRRQSIAAGAQEHLAKPCPSAVLTAAMARLARRKADEARLLNQDNQNKQNQAQGDIVQSEQTKRSA
jgi:PAS domain S-box-containing protein